MAEILVVEDDPIIRQTVDYALRRAGFDTRTSGDGLEALRMAQDLPPDVILLDLMLPGIDGFEFAAQVRKTDGHVAIIMVTALGEERDKVRGLDAGADDYLAKPFEIPELIARIQSALRRPTLAKRSTISFSDLTVSLDDHIVTRGGKRIELSAREFDLLAALLKSPNRVFSRAQLLDLVWGIDRDVTLGTVETYICYLRAKIDRGQSPLIHTIRGVGYSLREG